MKSKEVTIFDNVQEFENFIEVWQPMILEN